VSLEDRPADVNAAWAALKQRGQRWTRAASQGLNQIEPEHSELVTTLKETIE